MLWGSEGEGEGGGDCFRAVVWLGFAARLNVFAFACAFACSPCIAWCLPIHVAAMEFLGKWIRVVLLL